MEWTGMGCDVCGFGTIENIDEFNPQRPCPECGVVMLNKELKLPEIGEGDSGWELGPELYTWIQDKFINDEQTQAEVHRLCTGLVNACESKTFREEFLHMFCELEEDE